MPSAQSFQDGQRCEATASEMCTTHLSSSLGLFGALVSCLKRKVNLVKQLHVCACVASFSTELGFMITTGTWLGASFPQLFKCVCNSVWECVWNPLIVMRVRVSKLKPVIQWSILYVWFQAVASKGTSFYLSLLHQDDYLGTLGDNNLIT